MTFSILHPSARPDKWREVFDAWIKTCADRSNIEYVLCGDERWGFSGSVEGPDVFCLNHQRKCWVDSVNTAARAASGDVLIVIADDIWPCNFWDVLLAEAASRADNGVFAIEVSTGTPNEHERKLLAAPIVSRGWYEKHGYVLFPGYESMFGDNDVFEQAVNLGCLVDARDVKFEHRHAFFTAGAEVDSVYKHQNRKEAFEFGAQLLALRRQTNFGEAMAPKLTQVPRKPRIAVMVPGETFSEKWVGAWTDLIGVLEQKASNLQVFFGHSSNVYAMRNGLAFAATQMTPSPDLVLWIDDDQLVSTEAFLQLFDDLEQNKQIDVVAGWTWRQLKDGWVTSSWALGSKTGEPMTEADMLAGEPLKPISQSGFPVVLMRYSALLKAGRNPFLPLMSEEFQDGMSGEDTAFFVRARNNGAQCFVDRRVYVKHLKVGVLEPAAQSVVSAVEEVAS